MSKAVFRIFIVLGSLLIIVAIVIIVYGRIDDYLASERARNILDLVQEEGWEIPSTIELPLQIFPIRPAEDLVEDEEQAEDEEEQLWYCVVGILEIPVLGRVLPVLHNSTYQLLNISVCRYTGSAEDKPERLVIAGHNYKSHFGEISTLNIEDELLFTARDGETYRYKVERIESCHMSDVDAVQAGNDWDITLLTCQKDRTRRTLVRFQEVFD